MLLLVLNVNAQELVINELMAKNGLTLQDEDGDYSDWLELYNKGNSSINLENYTLSDDNEELDKWTFPRLILGPQEFLLVFASDKDRLNINELHTNFKISTSGERLFLSDNSGQLIDQTPAIELSEDQSYARVPDGSSNWLIANISSPGTSNAGAQGLNVSHDNGFYSEPFLLSVTSSNEDDIFYTLNGELPTPNSIAYSGAIQISDPTQEVNVFSEIPTTVDQDLISYKAWESPEINIHKARVVRVASFKSGVRTSPVVTKTYLVGPDISARYTVPVISLVTESKHFFSADSGIYVPGIQYNPEDPEWTGNYFMKGEEWERPVHLTYFEPSGEVGFSQDAGVRIHGGKTRQAAQKSLRLYARESYGKKYFNYKILPHRDNEEYKRLLLRTPMGAWSNPSMFQDEFIHNVSKELDIDYQDSQPVVVYLNGEYWGVHTIRDRTDERYLAYTHDTDKDSVELRGWGNPHYSAVTTFIDNNDLAIQDNYNYVKTQIDIDNYIDYNIVQQFFGNYDWPANNNEGWRKIPDGKWRWILYDLDGAFRDANYNMLTHTTNSDPNTGWPNPAWSTFLFRNLLKSDEFTHQFITRYSETLNSTFNLHSLVDRLETMKAIYNPLVADHSMRWKYPDNVNQWENAIDSYMMMFLQKRPCIVRENLISFFNLEDIDFTCITSVIDKKAISLTLAPNPNSGIFSIQADDVDISNATLFIYNVKGQLVYHSAGISLTSGENMELRLTGLRDGIYNLQLIDNDMIYQMRVVIVN